MDQVVSFLFKYSTALLSKGQFGFTSRPSILLFAAIACALGLLAYFLYSSRAARVTAGWRIALIALRCLIVLAIMFCIMRPVVVIPSVVPQSSYVLLLVDDSKSMSLPGDAKQTRLEQEKELTNAGAPFLTALGEKFKLRTLKFSQLAERMDDPGQLSGNGETTDINSGLELAAREAAGLPTAGIILITDGADNTSQTDDQRESNEQSRLTMTLSGLRTKGLPVYSVGIGPAEIEGDVELVRASTPRRVLTGSPVTAEVLVKSGSAAKSVRVDLVEDNHLLKSQDVAVQPNSTTVARVTFTPSSPGLHRYTLTSPPSDNDPAPANNTQDLLLEVSDAKPRILYFEGEPRWEYARLRESVYEEKNFTLVSVLRSADGKYYRQGIEKPDELASGFPKSEEQLFKYDALMLGSIEATFFSFDQLKAIEQFVARRGGTLLALGGTKSFNAGGYGNTPLADLLPIYLGSGNNATGENQGFKPAVAERGRDHPASRLKDDLEENSKAWDHMPAITLPQVIGEIKPGATVILEARSIKDKSRVAPLLIEERYGRGRSMALMASDTWRWRMMLESKDQSFETFWRNLFRYCLESVRHPVEVTTERGSYGRGERVAIKTEVDDEKFMPVRDAGVTARVVGPSGAVTLLQMKHSVAGELDTYSAEYFPTEDGSYRVEVDARREGKQSVDLGSARTNFLVGDLNREYRNAGQNADLLKRIAAETGGKYYHADQTGRLLEDISHTEGPSSIRETKELWDMPINFLIIVGLAGAEWFVRKRKGLA